MASLVDAGGRPDENRFLTLCTGIASLARVLWLLARIDERQPVSIKELRSEFRLDDAQMTSSLTSIGSRALVNTENRRFD